MTSVKHGIAMALMIGACGSAAAADLKGGISALERGDYSSALAELRPLADRGNAEAQYRLGTMYGEGLGVPFDYTAAAAWFAKAAIHGNASAQNALGVLCEQGRGVEQDSAQAVNWYRKAAEQGNAAAQVNLAFAYERGRGVPADPVDAYAWADAGSELGESRGQQIVDSVARNMSPVQIRQAQRRANQYHSAYVMPFLN